MKHFIVLFSTALLISSFSASSQVVHTKDKETKAKVKTQHVKMKIKGNLGALELP